MNRKLCWMGILSSFTMLIPLDFLTTAFALPRYGIEHEFNPITRTLLKQGIVPTTIANLLIVIIGIGVFAHLLNVPQTIDNNSERKQAERVLYTGILLFNVAGVVIVTNNIFYYFNGFSPYAALLRNTLISIILI